MSSEPAVVAALAAASSLCFLCVGSDGTHCTRYVCAVKPRPAAQPCGLPPAAAAFARPLAVKLS
jgi:hypothetical protein